MRITLTAFTGSFTLCAGGADSPLDGFEVTTDLNVQILERLRADGIKAVNRKNAKTQVTIPLYKQWNQFTAAENRFMIDHILNGRHGYLTFTTEPISGATFTAYLPDCVIGNIKTTYKGTSEFITYTVIGGKFTTVKPPNPTS